MHKAEAIDLAFQEGDSGNVSLTDCHTGGLCGHKVLWPLLLFHMAGIHVCPGWDVCPASHSHWHPGLLYCVYYLNQSWLWFTLFLKCILEVFTLHSLYGHLRMYCFFLYCSSLATPGWEGCLGCAAQHPGVTASSRPRWDPCFVFRDMWFLTVPWWCDWIILLGVNAKLVVMSPVS